MQAGEVRARLGYFNYDWAVLSDIFILLIV